MKKYFYRIIKGTVISFKVIYLEICVKISGKDLWIKEVDEDKSVQKIRFLSFVQGIFSGFDIIGGYIFLFYLPLGLALAIIYVIPVVGIILPRIFPRKKFGKYLSLIFSAVLLILCFAFLPLVLFYTKTYHVEESQENSTFSSTLNSTYNKPTAENSTTTNDPSNDSTPTFVGIEMYYLGVGMALLISISDAAHKIIVGYLYGNESTNSTILTTYYAGYGGIVVGLVAAIFDENQRILSSKIIDVSSLYWGILFGLAFLKLFTFLTINGAVKLIRPLILILVKYRKKSRNEQEPCLKK